MDAMGPRIDKRHREITYTGPMGQTVRLHCDWCPAWATGEISVGPGRSAGYCEDCKGKAERFHAAVTPELQHSPVLLGTAWLPSKDCPDLVIHHQGRSALTIHDHRQLKAKALKELLPPVKKARKRKASKVLTLPERIEDLARRRKALEDEQAALVIEIADSPEALVLADRLSIAGQPYQLAA